MDNRLRILIDVRDKATAQLKKLQKTVGGVTKNVQRSQQEWVKFGKGISSAGKKMLPFTLAVTTGFGKAIASASDLNEATSKTNAVFGESADQIVAWSQTAAQSMGLSSRAALDNVSIFKDMSTSMGLTNERGTEMSMNLVQLSADMSSFHNISSERANIALKAIYTGETEVLKNYGVVMTVTNLEEFARQKGIRKTLNEMTQLEKVELRYQFVMSKTAAVQGDFARTADGVANKQRIVTAEMENSIALMGQRLLPAWHRVLDTVRSAINWFNNLSNTQRDVVIAIAAIIAIIPPLLIAIGGAITMVNQMSRTQLGLVSVIVILVSTITFLVFNWQRAQHYIGIVGAAIAAGGGWMVNQVINALGYLGGGIAAMIEGWLWAKDMVMFVTKSIANAFIWMVNKVTGAFNSLIEGAISAINAVINLINKIPGVDIAKIDSKGIKIPVIPTFDTGSYDLNLFSRMSGAFRAGRSVADEQKFDISQATRGGERHVAALNRIDREEAQAKREREAAEKEAKDKIADLDEQVDAAEDAQKAAEEAEKAAEKTQAEKDAEAALKRKQEYEIAMAELRAEGKENDRLELLQVKLRFEEEHKEKLRLIAEIGRLKQQRAAEEKRQEERDQRRSDFIELVNTGIGFDKALNTDIGRAYAADREAGIVNYGTINVNDPETGEVFKENLNDDLQAGLQGVPT